MKRITTIWGLMIVAVALMSACCQQQTGNFPANRKEVMDQFVAGTLDPSYVPAAFFSHFSSDAKVGEAAVQAHLKYYLRTNQDVLKVQFEQSVPKIENFTDPSTWEALEPIPVDFYAPTLEVITGLQNIAGADVYVLPTIYSPNQVSLQALGEEGIREAANNHPEEYKRLLGYYVDALNWLVDACKSAGIEGFYMTCQGGEMKYYDIPDFFGNFVKPFDLAVMNNCVDGTRMNILHICDWEGVYDDLTRYVDYPGQIVNTPINLNGTIFTTADGEKLFNRPVLGGLDRHGEINTATQEELASIVKKAIADGPAGRLMIGAECTVSQAPLDNIHAAVHTAHHSGTAAK